MSRLEKSLDDFRANVDKRFETVQDALNKLYDVTLTQAKTDGNVGRIDDANKRIGKQVDEIDGRLRIIEQSGASQKTGLSHVKEATSWLVNITVVSILLYIAIRQG